MAETNHSSSGYDRSNRRYDGSQRAGGVRFGKPIHKIQDPAATYFALAEDDEQAACRLKDAGHFRQSMYFAIQAMEKYLRYAIFSEISADEEDESGVSYRERTWTHELDTLIGILLEVYTERIGDDRVSEQIREQFDRLVLEGTRFGQLHNDVRYPRYSTRHSDYTLVEYDGNDVASLLRKLERLKRFVTDFRRWRGEDVPVSEPAVETDEFEEPAPAEEAPHVDESTPHGLDAGLFDVFKRQR